MRPMPSDSGALVNRRFSFNVPSMIPGWHTQSLRSPYSIEVSRSRSTPQAACCSTRDRLATVPPVQPDNDGVGALGTRPSSGEPACG